MARVSSVTVSGAPAAGSTTSARKYSGAGIACRKACAASRKSASGGSGNSASRQ
jgi:hypothetical protein